MSFELNENVNFVLSELNKYGQGFLVGGAVRDLIMGKKPDDFDFATNINYNKLKNIFYKYYPKEIGKSFGILMIKVKNDKFEIAKFRKDIGIENGRHPQKVEFIEDINIDLERRDFTMNAIAYNNSLGFIDPFNGSTDIINKVIKFVGNPEKRIEEDALRILRAFRFVSKLSFNLDINTYEAIKLKKYNLEKISIERISSEFLKILVGPNVKKALILMKETGVLEIIIPEIKETYNFNQNNPHHDKDLFMHLLDVVERTENDQILRLAALFHDIGKTKSKTTDQYGISHFYGHETISAKIVQDRLSKLKIPYEIINLVVNLILNHMIALQNPSDKTIKKIILTLGINNVNRLMSLFRADLNSKPDSNTEEVLLKIKERFDNVYSSGSIISINQIDITGIDLQNLGLYNVDIGKFKQKVYNEILSDNIDNSKIEILKYFMKEYNYSNKIDHEKSCGAIILRENKEKKGDIEYLIVKIHGGNWGFPKGHVENDENELETAIREVREETNLEISILNGYKEKISYIPKKFIYKEVVYFLGVAINKDVEIDGIEISDYYWGTLPQTLKKITYKVQKDILLKADEFVNQNRKNIRFTY